MEILSRAASDFAPGVEHWLLQSAHVDQIFRVCVASPLAARDGAKPGVLYGLDGSTSSGTIIGVTRALASAGELPPLFAVTIGYPIDTPVPTGLLRTRDLTPWSAPALDAAGEKIWGPGGSVRTGGGENFRAFIAQELMPLIESEYPVAEGEAGIVGSSLAGLFALWCFLTAPKQFNRHNVINPSCWYNNHAALDLARETVGRAFAPTSRMFLSAGAYETGAHVHAWAHAQPDGQREGYVSLMEAIGWHSLADDVMTLAQILAKINTQSFVLETEIFPKESHESVYPVALSRGLRAIYETPVTRAMAAVDHGGL